MKRFKSLLVYVVIFFNTTISFSQSKKPTLMVLPSDNWCVQRYFISEFDNQGTTIKIPNYKQAFQEDGEIGQVISKIGSLLIERGFPIKDAEQELKNLDQQSAEDAMTSSSSTGTGFEESSLDKLKRRAKADVIIQIWWSVNKTEKGKSINFILEALDAYTSKKIASSTGTGMLTANDPIPLLLQNAVQANINVFTDQLLQYFTDMFNNGREIIVRVKKWQNWKNNLETEYGGKELSDIINEWMQKNTVNNKFNATDVTENIMNMEQVRIPLADDQKKPIDARMFVRELQKFLKNTPYNIDSKVLTRGLGEAILVLGEK